MRTSKFFSVAGMRHMPRPQAQERIQRRSPDQMGRPRGLRQIIALTSSRSIFFLSGAFYLSEVFFGQRRVFGRQIIFFVRPGAEIEQLAAFRAKGPAFAVLVFDAAA